MQFRISLAASVAALPLACGLAFAIATPVAAQETSSGVRGTVESGGKAVSGATVTIVHEPSGTTATTTTGSDGSFSANGLRIGGPFTVTVEAPGYQSATVSDVNLQAGQPARLPIRLDSQQEIVVTGASLQPAIALSDGPTTALGRAEIENAASINRDIRDLARRDPLVTIDLTNSRTIEIAGNNGRLNRFSVDGMQMSDDFGLNNGGLPTNRGPVPYDAIEQFTVKVAPFDVAEGDMQGGAINVNLKSGGNKFHGGAFYSYTGDGLTGKTAAGTNVALDFSSKQFGGWLSGPIIKDKLFFMLAYERTKEGRPVEDGIGAAFANQIPNITQGLIDQVSSIAKSRYAYDTLGQVSTFQEADEKLVGKIDWNIADDHRASMTFIRNVGTNQFQNNNFRTPIFALGLASNGYQLREEVNSGTVELNSTWSDKFSTTLRGSYRDYNRAQVPLGALGFPNMEVCLDPTAINSGTNSATSCGSARLFFGPDVSRHSNALNTDNLSLDFTARYDSGDHALRFIAGYTRVRAFNLFFQRTLGDFYFDSLADFQSGTASRLRYGNAVPSNNPNDAASRFSTTNWTFGLQDDWQVTDKLGVSLGLRYDRFANSPVPPLNPNFLARTGFTNQATFDGRGVWQPRAAFNWEASDRLIIRGGIGVFAGGTPDVFVSNVYSNTGLLTNAVDINRANCVALGNTCSALDNVMNGTIPAGVVNFLTTNVASLAQAPTDAIDPNLRIAHKLKVSLQADYKANLGGLGDNWLFGVQFLFDKALDGYMWRDLRSVQVGTLPDGRPRYGPIGGVATTNRDLLLTNTGDGRGIFATFRFEKNWDMGLGIEGSYTRSDVKDRAALTNSTSSSNYNNNVFFDPNLPEYGRSIYEYTHQYKFGINYRRKFFGDNKTSFGLFGERRSGRPYTVTMLDNTGTRGTVVGTVGNLGNQLLYVPTTSGDARVSFDSAVSEAAFNTLVDQLGLGQYRGGVVPKNALTSPNFFKVDFHFGQELPVPLTKGAKLEAFVDIENVLNLIDSDWGVLRQVPFAYTSPLVRVSCLSTATPTGTAPAAGVVNTASTQTCAQYRYSNVLAPSVNLESRLSLYGIRVGVRVKF